MFHLARFLHLEQIQNQPPQKNKRSNNRQCSTFSADGLFTVEKINISALKYPVSRDAHTPVCILIVTGVAKANTLKYIWKKKERRFEELYVLLFKIFRGMCWGG